MPRGGNLRPRLRNRSATSTPTGVSAGGMIQGSSASSDRSTFRRRDHGFFNPATTVVRSLNKTSVSMSSSCVCANSPDNEIDLSLAQLAVLLRYGSNGCHLNGNTRILLSEPAEYRRNQAGNDEFVACDSDFTDRRIGQKLDALHALAQFIEHRCNAAEQCVVVLSRLDALATAIEQTNAECMLQLGDRS